MSARSSRAIGVAQVLASGFCFGFLGLLGKRLFALGVTPGEMLSLRFLVGALLLIGVLAVIRPRSLALPPRQLAATAALGMGGYAVFSSCFFTALTGLSVSLTVLLLYAYPVLVTLFGFLLLGERVPRSRWIALPLVCAGLGLLIWGDIEVRSPSALGFGLAAAAFYSAYILASRRWLASSDPFAAGAFVMLFAGLALAAVHWREPERLRLVVTAAWPQLLAVALVCTVAAMTLFLAGLQKLQSWEVSLLSTSEPVTGIALAAVFLGERLSVTQVAGASLVLLVFVLVSLPARAPA